MYPAVLGVMVAGAALVVVDTLVRRHTHPHQHTFTHFHGGYVHAHTATMSGIAAHRFRRTRLYGLRQHGNRRLFARFAILCIKRKRWRRKCDGGQYESVSHAQRTVNAQFPGCRVALIVSRFA
jgi:hypothetical protein